MAMSPHTMARRLVRSAFRRDISNLKGKQGALRMWSRQQQGLKNVVVAPTWFREARRLDNQIRNERFLHEYIKKLTAHEAAFLDPGDVTTMLDVVCLVCRRNMNPRIRLPWLYESAERAALK